MSQSRGQWSGKLGFILAAAGSAVGLGNLWKFPYITLENNGGAFVLVYIGAVIVVGLPIMMAEILMGRRTQRNPVGSFRALAKGALGPKLWPVVGMLGVITGFIILSYYCTIAGWTIRYILMALTGRLGEIATSPDALGGYFVGFLGRGGEQVLYHSLFMGLTLGVVYFGVKRGIERAARILMPALFAILTGMLIYSFFTPGIGQALSFLFRPNFAELTRGGVLEAVGHSFFTLSLGMGAMLTYGSYMRRDNSIAQSALAITALDTIIAIMACVIMFSIIHSYPGGIEVQKSSSILFTTLPLVFYKLPIGALMSSVFYLLVAFGALTSTISLLEVVSSWAIDELKWSRRRAVTLLGAAAYVFGVLSALSVGGAEHGAHAGLSRINLIGRASTEGFFGTMDYLASNWFLPVGGMLVALFVGWVLTGRETREELEAGHGRLGWFPFWRFLIRFAAPLAVGAIIVSVILGAEYQ